MATYIDKSGTILSLAAEKTLRMTQVETNARGMVLCDLLGVTQAELGEEMDKLEEEDPERLKELMEEAQEVVEENLEAIAEALSRMDITPRTELIPIEELMKEVMGREMTAEEAEALYLKEMAPTWTEFKEGMLATPEWD